jgi:hypothetical protein
MLAYIGIMSVSLSSNYNYLACTTKYAVIVIDVILLAASHVNIA